MDSYKNASILTAALVEMNVEGWHGGNHCRGPAVPATLWLASASRCIWLLQHVPFVRQEEFIQDMQGIFVCMLQIKVKKEDRNKPNVWLRPLQMGSFLTHRCGCCVLLQLELYPHCFHTRWRPQCTKVETSLYLQQEAANVGKSYLVHFSKPNCVNYLCASKEFGTKSSLSVFTDRHRIKNCCRFYQQSKVSRC